MAKAYYNGVLLPELPSDITIYPYLLLVCSNEENKYSLYGCTHQFYMDNNITNSVLELKTFESNSEIKKRDIYNCTLDASEWTKIGQTQSSYSYVNEMTDASLIWTNTDIPYDSEDSTEIYMRASEPILDSEEECYSITKTKLSRFGDEIRRISGKTEPMETNEMIEFLKNIHSAEGVGF